MENLIARLDRVFNPRVVAVVGDKSSNGYMWLRSNSTFTGKLYSVQIDEKEIPGIEAMGIPNYRSLLDVPDEIDYVLCAVPRAVSPRVIADCIAKKVGGVGMFTSGFAETEEEEGIHLQKTLTDMARQGDLLIVGPNCMGIYNPEVGVRFSADAPTGEAGEVGIISQSGTHAINLTITGAAQGLKISKAVSIGNSIILDAADYLEYLAQDQKTKVICLYLEAPRNGRRFFQMLKETTQKKPVVVWKGGLTSAGERAIYSHTASLATPSNIWEGMMRQCGAVTADTVDEALDTLKALLYTKPSTGKRLGLVAMTGGQSVVISDAFAREGLEVPLLTDASYAKLASFFNTIGGSYRNPFDAGGTIGMGFRQENLQRILDTLDEDPNIDAVALEVRPPFARRMPGSEEAFARLLDSLVAFKERSAKPIITLVYGGAREGEAAEIRGQLMAREIPCFHSFDRGARALAKAIAYWRFRQDLD